MQVKIADGIWMNEVINNEVIVAVRWHPLAARTPGGKPGYVAEVTNATTGKVDRQFLKSIDFTEWENGKWYKNEGEHDYAIEFNKIYEVQPRIQNGHDQKYRKYLRFTKIETEPGYKIEILKLGEVIKSFMVGA